MDMTFTPYTSSLKITEFKQDIGINKQDLLSSFNYDKEALKQVIQMFKSEKLYTPSKKSVDMIMQYARLKHQVL